MDYGFDNLLAVCIIIAIISAIACIPLYYSNKQIAKEAFMEQYVITIDCISQGNGDKAADLLKAAVQLEKLQDLVCSRKTKELYATAQAHLELMFSSIL